MILVGLRPEDALAVLVKEVPSPEDFNAFLIVQADGRVRVMSGKIEMGQGVMTSQAQLVSEELGVALGAIDLVLGDTDVCPWDRGTFGSLSTRMFGPVLRAAAARARVELFALASARLGVPPTSLVVHEGLVQVVDDPDAHVTYGELSKGARLTRVVGEAGVLHAAADFQVMGRSPARLDARDKVTGAAKYAADVRRPGLLHARVLRPPMHGSKRSKLVTSAARALPGVLVVELPDLVAVLHANPEGAAAALERLSVEWTQPEATLDPENIGEHLQASATGEKTVVERGSLATGRAASAKSFFETFRKGYVAHAAIEPHAALAELVHGVMTVWASTQTPFPTRDRIALAVGLAAQKVRVITPFLGGGFGGKSADEQAIEAARLAQKVGRPVQVAWTRAEEFFFDHFDPASVVTVTAGLDAQGLMSVWDARIIAAGDRGSTPFYAVPNVLVRSSGGTAYGEAAAGASLHPFAVGPWRGPGANMNVFASESMVDLMASATGVDPVAFRLKNLTDERMKRVVQAAAKAFGWTPAVAPSRRGVGVACSIDAGSYVATMAEVKVDAATGHVAVLRLVCAIDLGVVVNPEGARQQVEGGLSMGLGYALFEELRFRGGAVLDRNFDSYRLPCFSHVPHLETVFVKNDALAPQGAGEPPITTTGAVIANAIFDATGARLTRLPMTAERVKQAMAREAR